jgi:hypothetical protein
VLPRVKKGTEIDDVPVEQEGKYDQEYDCENEVSDYILGMQ